MMTRLICYGFENERDQRVHYYEVDNGKFRFDQQTFVRCNSYDNKLNN